MTSRRLTIAGGLLGLLLFVGIGAVPALVYGGYAGVALVGWLFGSPVQIGLASRVVVGFAMAVGAVAVGGMFVVGGAVTGAAIAALGAAPGRSARKP